LATMGSSDRHRTCRPSSDRRIGRVW
jgi:hypothetical protein